MAKFILKKQSDAEFMFNLVADNGQVILTSERYQNRGACERGILSAQTNSQLIDRYQTWISISGQHYFDLTGKNGEIIGTSELYSSRAAMEKGIHSVIENGSTEEVEDWR